MFIEDEKWEPDATARTTLRNLYSDYKTYCAENGYKALGRNKFGKRLEANGITRMDANQPVFLIARNSSENKCFPESRKLEKPESWKAAPRLFRLFRLSGKDIFAGL